MLSKRILKLSETIEEEMSRFEREDFDRYSIPALDYFIELIHRMKSEALLTGKSKEWHDIIIKISDAVDNQSSDTQIYNIIANVLKDLDYDPYDLMRMSVGDLNILLKNFAI